MAGRIVVQWNGDKKITEVLDVQDNRVRWLFDIPSEGLGTNTATADVEQGLRDLFPGRPVDVRPGAWGQP